MNDMLPAEPAPETPPPTDPVLVADMIDAVDEEDRRWLSRNLARMHPADAADALEQLSIEIFQKGVALLGPQFPADVLSELRDEYREDAVETLSDEVLAEAVGLLDSDDATAILQDLDEVRRARVLSGIDPAARASLEQGLAFGAETAGRLMQREFVAAPEFWTVGEAIDQARARGDALPTQFYEIYVVDPGMHVKGAVALSQLLRTPREVPLADIMRPLLSSIRTDMDQEEVAYQFQKYSLAQAPVRDEDDRLIGMITVDDMVHVIQAENTEDLLALSNVRSADPSHTVWQSVKARAPWLAVNLVTAFFVSGVISIFEDTLDRIVQLAILMPVVAALGGNAGSQGLAVAVRAIAEREMDGKLAQRAVVREILTALVNGLIFALGVGAIAYGWFRDVELAVVIAAAMMATFLWAGLSGILVPLGLRRLGADPAVASSVFVLTFTDVVAFFSFLGLATLVLI